MEDLTRRTLIVGGSAAAAAGLAGCSSSAATPSAPQPASAAGGVKVKAADVPVGGGIILQDAKYVVTQPTAGTYQAFDKTCTHQACPVTKIVGTNIQCLCHGSAFSIVDGSVTQPPARTPLKAAKVSVQGDSLVITD